MTYGDLRAVDGVSLEVGRGRVRRHPRPQRRRQDDHAGDHRGAAPARRGHGHGARRSRSGRATRRCCPRIGVQLQASSFFERLTAREQIHTFAALYGVRRRRPRTSGWSGSGWSTRPTPGSRTSPAARPSGSSIACALVHDPEVVFLDEPTAALDPQARRNLWDLLSRAQRLRPHRRADHALHGRGRGAVRPGRDHGPRPDPASSTRPAALVRGLDAPARITVAPGQLDLDDGPRHRRRRRGDRGRRRAWCSPPGSPRPWSSRLAEPTSSTACACRPAPSRTSSSTSPAGSTAHEHRTARAVQRPLLRGHRARASSATRPRSSSRSSSR